MAVGLKVFSKKALFIHYYHKAVRSVCCIYHVGNAVERNQGTSWMLPSFAANFCFYFDHFCVTLIPYFNLLIFCHPFQQTVKNQRVLLLQIIFCCGSIGVHYAVKMDQGSTTHRRLPFLFLFATPFFCVIDLTVLVDFLLVQYFDQTFPSFSFPTRVPYIGDRNEGCRYGSLLHHFTEHMYKNQDLKGEIELPLLIYSTVTTYIYTSCRLNGLRFFILPPIDFLVSFDFLLSIVLLILFLLFWLTSSCPIF